MLKSQTVSAMRIYSNIPQRNLYGRWPALASNGYMHWITLSWFQLSLSNPVILRNKSACTQ